MERLERLLELRKSIEFWEGQALKLEEDPIRNRYDVTINVYSRLEAKYRRVANILRIKKNRFLYEY